MKHLAALMMATAFACAGPALAQDCSEAEKEPNNTPDNASRLALGECVTGSLEGNDQDAFVPVLGNSAAQLVLTGEGAGLLKADIFRLQRNEDGGITAADGIAAVATPLGGGQVQVPVSLVEGDYIIGLSRAGGSVDYTLSLNEPTLNEDATITRQGTGDAKIEWELGEEASQKLWRISFAGSTNDAPDLILRNDESGEVVSRRADQWGSIDLTSYGLDPGNYTFYVDTGDEAPWHLSVLATGERRPEVEREPNDSGANAQPLEGTRFVRGQLSDGRDEDLYLLDLEEGERKGLKLRGLGLSEVTLCVRAEGGEPECRQARRRVGFEAVESPSGSPLLLSVAHEGNEPLDYQLSIRDPQGEALRGFAEPNQARTDAPLLAENGKGEGRLVGREYDSFILETDSQGVWRINVTASDNLDWLTYYGGRYGKLTSESRGRQATLDSLVLPAGRHLFTMRGSHKDGEGRYFIDATRLGDVADDRELEPNNSRRTATPMSPGDKRAGTLAAGDDSDGFLISTETATPMRVTLEVGDAADLEFEVHPVTGGDFDARAKAGGTYVMERRFEAGESLINLKPYHESASYRLYLEAIDRGEFASRIDREPNNSPQTAGDLPLDGRVTGGFDDYGDWARYYGPYDIYRLPNEWAARSLIVTGDAGGASLDIVNSANDTIQELSVSDDRSGSGAGKLPGKTPIYLRVDDGKKPYDLTIWPAGETPPDLGDVKLSAEISLDKGNLPLAAHWPAPQPVSGTLEITNAGEDPADVQINLRTDIIGARLRPEAETVEIATGETVGVAFGGALPEYLPARRPITVIADVNGPGRTATSVELPVEAGKSPQAIAHNRGIPESMFGGINLAASSVGGQMLEAETADEDEREDLHFLIDGMVGRESTFEAWVGDGVREPVVAVGFDTAPVAGIVLYPHPAQVRRYPATAPSYAVVEARIGGTWRETWRGELATGLDEIVIAFEDAVDADAVRVRMRNYGAQILRLSELKVIADPQYDPTGGNGYEVASFARGGEMLGGVPALQNATAVVTRTSDKVALFRGWHDPAPEFTTAFRFHRSAEIDRLRWTPVESNGNSRPAIDSLVVKAGPGNLSGPWQEIGTLTRSEPELTLDNPVEARYLRFLAVSPGEGVASARTVRITRDIEVYERAPGDGYTSVLGFYGHARQRSVPEVKQETASSQTGGQIDFEQAVSGIVERGETAPEYAITVPENANRIVLAFDPEHPILPQVRLNPSDEGGTLLSQPGPEQAEDLRERFDIPEGYPIRVVEAEAGDHDLVFNEPRRSLLVTWDTSGSIGSFRPAILRSLDLIATEIDPEMDAIGLLPFGSSSLLGGEWLTDRETVRTLLRSVSKNDSSSATSSFETGLKMLDSRAGARALLTVTDMDDPSIDYRTRRPYDLLEETGALMFAGQINGGGLASGWSLFGQRRRLRGFTLASDGSFAEVVNPTQIVDLFETAMGRLRGPKPYEVTAYAYNQKPPPPGKLVVAITSEAGDEDSRITLNPVEIVLDASGSMLQRLPDGRRRIVAAKASIKDLVTSGLPAGTPAALRVFGHLEPDSCDTRLVQPLTPISDGGFVEKLEQIQARNLAKTPIAESLRLTARDLDSAEGDPLVVLLTDGDETCGGDPRKVLAELRAQGMDLKVSVVGFAVGAELDETFRSWAEAGNGQYYKADDSSSLSDALRTAVHPEFEILDSSGNVAKMGVPGAEPISLPVGQYSLVFPGGQTRTVNITSGATTRVEIAYE
ncbi:MAG: VWA domain-containing protein [Henriciella sp.]|uniref:vWA domain-containing protein n=1 Tax=Henriciella sp. TaxID=1968823 RepID=UPI0032EF0975